MSAKDGGTESRVNRKRARCGPHARHPQRVEKSREFLELRVTWIYSHQKQKDSFQKKNMSLLENRTQNAKCLAPHIQACNKYSNTAFPQLQNLGHRRCYKTIG